jgi:TetR/AcrR family transcriptional repressor of nem operon
MTIAATTRSTSTEGDTASRVLDVAERLVQSRGFNGFSYADVAAEIGVTTAALHYHFPGKAELGNALVERYARRFFEALSSIDRSGSDARAKLEAYADLYLDVLRDDRMCLCGMLAAEYRTLPEAMQARLRSFFDENEVWVAGVLDEGAAAGVVRLARPPREVAGAVVGALEGAMLIARPYDDAERFRTAASQLIESLFAREASPTPRRPGAG